MVARLGLAVGALVTYADKTGERMAALMMLDTTLGIVLKCQRMRNEFARIQ